MADNRVIKSIPLEELSDVDTFFTRLSGVDPEHVEPKYGTAVEDAKRIVMEKCSAGLVYERVGIRFREGNTVVFSTGESIEGKVISKVLADSDELYAFVVTVKGFDSLGLDDVMLDYFASSWGSAYTECAQTYVANEIQAILQQEGKKRTHIWSPGQHAFDLSNQSALFNLLHPEDIECTLTKRLMMKPVKSASGVIGVIDKDVESILRPCDFCMYKDNCPAAHNDCAVM